MAHCGGVAIGLASNVSPIYISEISRRIGAAAWSALTNSLVVGILLAQIVDWRIALFGGASNSSAVLAWNSWAVQYGWRWMFTAVAILSVVFLTAALLFPKARAGS